MNIKSFISNIFSSSNKDRKGNQQDTPLTPKGSTDQTSDEYLLSNLRKSKLFMDDMIVGSCKKETNPESYPNQAVSQVEKSVGLIPSASFESFASRQSSKMQPRSSLTDSAKKRLSAETITGFFERTSIVGDNPDIAGFKPRTTGGFFNQLDRLHEIEISAINPKKVSGENNSSKIPAHISYNNIFQTQSQITNNQNPIKVGTSMSSYQHELQGNHDIEREIYNQGDIKLINMQPPQSPSCVEKEGSFKGDQLTSSLKEQMECLSTKAQPPTQAKNRYNSFFFGETSAEKQQQQLQQQPIDFCSIPRASSSKHSSASSKKSMSIESPSSGSKQQVSVFNKDQAYESRSAGSSPGRTSLHVLHKQIEMMIDKSEIPPPHLLRSNQKVPSPIKEVDELSQKHGNKPSQKDSIKLKSSQDNADDGGFIERQPIQESDELRSPKLRQKSVKFENPKEILTPEHSKCKNSQNDAEGDDIEGNCEKLDGIEHNRHHNLKLQLRIPTPYNPGKQIPHSHLLGQNKYNPEEPQNVARPLFTKGQQNDDIEQAESISSDNIVTQKDKNKDKDNQGSLNPKKVLSSSKTVEKQNNVSSNNIFTQKLEKQLNLPLNSSNNSKLPKQPLAIKPKDVLAFKMKNQDTKNNNIPRGISNKSTHTTSQPSSIQIKPQIASENNTKPFGNGNNRIQNLNTRKRQMTTEEGSNSGIQRKIKVSKGDSLSVPKNTSLTRNNTLGTLTTSVGPISVYKTCVFCTAEIKPKEKITTFACCHKAHNDCLLKEKNPVCGKCNVNKLNKLRTNKS